MENSLVGGFVDLSLEKSPDTFCCLYWYHQKRVKTSSNCCITATESRNNSCWQTEPGEIIPQVSEKVKLFTFLTVMTGKSVESSFLSQICNYRIVNES
jgi:hypothetical protein